MVEKLENTTLNMKPEDIGRAKTIAIRGAQEYVVAENYENLGNSGPRIYSCDADCDSCHCATY